MSHQPSVITATSSSTSGRSGNANRSFPSLLHLLGSGAQQQVQIVGGRGRGHGFRFFNSAAIQLVNHGLFLIANFLVFIALIVTLILQGLSLIFSLKQTAQCLWMMAVRGGARLLEILSPWAPPGERERLLAGLALVNTVLSAVWLRYAYSIPYATVRDYFRSWFYATVLAAQLFAQVSVDQLTSISRRMNLHHDDLTEQGRQTFLWTLVLHASLVLLGSVLVMNVATSDRSLSAFLLLRDPFISLLRGLFLDRFALTASSGVSGDGTRMLHYDLCRYLLHSVVDYLAVCAATTPQQQRFLTILFLGNIASIGVLAMKVWSAYQSERRLTDRFPKLTEDEVDRLGIDETCPICLDGHIAGDSVRLPCSHLVHGCCLLRMIRSESMPASSERTYYADYDVPLGFERGAARAAGRAGTWPAATSRQRCPMCRSDLNILAGSSSADSNNAPAAAGSSSVAAAAATNSVHPASTRRRRGYVDSSANANTAVPQQQATATAHGAHALLRFTVGGSFLLDARDFFSLSTHSRSQPPSRPQQQQPQPHSQSHPQSQSQSQSQFRPRQQPQSQLPQSQQAQSFRPRLPPSTVIDSSTNNTSRSSILTSGICNSTSSRGSNRTHHNNNGSGKTSSGGVASTSRSSRSVRTARRDHDLHEELNYWLPATATQSPAVTTAGNEEEDVEEASVPEALTRSRKRKAAAVRVAVDPPHADADTARPKRIRSHRIH